jgi:ferredoxin
MRRIVRVWIDYDFCLTDGFCVGECPEVFHFTDDDPEPRVRLIDYGPVDAKVRSAVRCCPYDAIHIEEADAV